MFHLQQEPISQSVTTIKILYKWFHEITYVCNKIMRHDPLDLRTCFTAVVRQCFT